MGGREKEKRETETQRELYSHNLKERETETERDTQRETNRQTDRQTGRQADNSEL